MRVLGQHAALRESLDDRARRDVRREFDAGPQAAPAHGQDQRRAQAAEPVEQVRAKRLAALHELLVLDDAQRLEGHARRERIAAEGRTVASGTHQVEHRRARDECGDREQAAAQGLADDDGVGTDAFVHVGEPGAGAAEARLDLVDDQQDVARGAQFARGAQEAWRRRDDAGFALDRLDQDRAGVLVDRFAESRDVAEVEVPEPGRERAEVGAVVVFRGETDHGRGPPVEIAAGDDDLGPVRIDPLGPITPATRGLDGRLDRFAAAARRERACLAIEVGHLDQLGEEGREFSRVVCARGDRHALGLFDQGADEARMRVAVADRRIRRHEVEVTPAISVPQPAAFAALEHHGQRRIVRRRNGGLEFDQFLRLPDTRVHRSPRTIDTSTGWEV